MIKSTKDYSLFKLRNDNREHGINKTHLDYLIEKIKLRNLLDLNPIIVNEDFEVINGQHRLEAAKRLNLPIYYRVIEKCSAKDIIDLNFSKSWTMSDYLHFYCENNYEEYIKLKEFIYKSRLTLKVALNLSQGNSRKKIMNLNLEILSLINLFGKMYLKI